MKSLGKNFKKKFEENSSKAQRGRRRFPIQNHTTKMNAKGCYESP